MSISADETWIVTFVLLQQSWWSLYLSVDLKTTKCDIQGVALIKADFHGFGHSVQLLPPISLELQLNIFQHMSYLQHPFSSLLWICCNLVTSEFILQFSEFWVVCVLVFFLWGNYRVLFPLAGYYLFSCENLLSFNLISGCQIWLIVAKGLKNIKAAHSHAQTVLITSPEETRLNSWFWFLDPLTTRGSRVV